MFSPAALWQLSPADLRYCSSLSCVLLSEPRAAPSTRMLLQIDEDGRTCEFQKDYGVYSIEGVERLHPSDNQGLGYLAHFTGDDEFVQERVNFVECEEQI